MIHTDIARRAVPWSELIFESGDAPYDLNLGVEQRMSVALVGVAAVMTILALLEPRLLAPGAAAVASVLFLNRKLFGFFAQRYGLLFATACVPLHLLHYLIGGLGYGYAWLRFRLHEQRAHAR